MFYWTSMIHGYFKMDNVSYHNVYDDLPFISKICVHGMCVRAVSRHHSRTYKGKFEPDLGPLTAPSIPLDILF